MKEVVILACSKMKLWSKETALKEKSMQAKDAYRGPVFQYGKKYAEKHNLPYWILSAKYGIVKPDKLIEDYNIKLENKKSALKIKEEFRKTLEDLFLEYDKIFLIGGNKYYRMVFEGFNDKKFHYLKSKNQADLRKKAKRLAEK